MGPLARLAGALAACFALARGQRAVLVFEDEAYIHDLLVSGPSSGLELLKCGSVPYCSDLPDSVLRSVVAVVGTPKDITILQRLPALRLVQSNTYQHSQLSEVPPRATVAAYLPDWRDDYGVEPIGEFVLAAVFEWNYKLREKARSFADCAWGKDAPASCPLTKRDLTAHPVLMNQTLGVLGYGRIGQAVARRSAALGMRTVATKVHGPFTPPPAPLAWLSDDNDRLFRESDYVVTTVPGSVKDIVNRTSLQLMKPGAVVIPITAPHADFDALRDALRRRQIGGAVLDVWPAGCWHFPEEHCGPPYGPPAEPYAGGDLATLDNVLPLPGMAMRDDRFWAESATWVAGNLRALAHGLPLRGVVRSGTSTEAPAAGEAAVAALV